METRTTAGGVGSASSRSRTAKPSESGRTTSRSTTSGRRSVAASRPDAASAASPTTSNAPRSSTIRAPPRNPAWSSITRTLRTIRPIVHGRASAVPRDSPGIGLRSPGSCPDGTGAGAIDRGAAGGTSVNCQDPPPRPAGAAMNASLVRRWALVVAVGSALVLAWHGRRRRTDRARATDFVPHQAIDEAFLARFVWLRGIATHDLGVRILAAISFLALAGLGRRAQLRDATKAASAAPARRRRWLRAGGCSSLPAGRDRPAHRSSVGSRRGDGGFDVGRARDIGHAEPVLLRSGGRRDGCRDLGVFGTAALLGAFATRGWLAIPGVVLGAALLVIAASWWIDDPADLSSPRCSPSPGRRPSSRYLGARASTAHPPQRAVFAAPVGASSARTGWLARRLAGIAVEPHCGRPHQRVYPLRITGCGPLRPLPGEPQRRLRAARAQA